LCNPGVTGERRWADTGLVRFTGAAGSNSFVIMSQGWIGERYKVCEIVNRGRLDSVGLTKQLGGFIDG
jgi:hypothetical protein